MKRIHLFVNESKRQAVEGRRLVSEIATRCGLESVDESSAEAVIALGGDGTLLRAVRQHPGLPVLGLNLGGLGFLASVEEKDFAYGLSSLAGDRYRLSERSILEVDGHAALNDVVIVRERTGHAADFELSVDDCLSTHYTADGLIFATPTGSTAYSLAAGGPVLMPDSRSFVVTPMNPHALGIRPMVVGDSARFAVAASVRTAEDGAKIAVYADGAFVRTIAEGERILFGRAEHRAKLIELDGYDPYAVLARKLGWSGSNVKNTGGAI